MFRIATALFLVLALPILAPAQQDTLEQRLAEARKVEEVESNPTKALAIYEAVWKTPSIANELKLRAGLGYARCLRRLGRTDEARPVIEALAGIFRGSEAELRQIEEERKLLERRDPAGQEALEESYVNILSQGRLEDINLLGKAALPMIEATVEGRMVGGRGFAQSAGFKELLYLRIPERPEVAARLLRAWEDPTNDKLAAFSGLKAVMEKDTSVDWDPLIHAGLEDPDFRIREKAAGFLNYLTRPTWDTWRAVLEDSSPKVRLAAIESLIQSTRSVEDAWFFDAMDRASHDANGEVRRRALGALPQAVRRDAARATALVDRFLADESSEVRRAGYEQAGKAFPQSRKADYYRRGLKDVDERVRTLCASRMIRYVEATDLETLKGLLVDESQKVRVYASQALLRFGAAEINDSAEMQAVLVDRLSEESLSIRGLAATVLCLTGGEDLTDRFIPLLWDKDGNIRWSALYFLIRHDRIDALPKILEVLSLELEGMYYRPADYPGDYPDLGSGHDALVSWMVRGGYREEFLKLLEHANELRANSVTVAEAVRTLLGAEGLREVFALLKSSGSWGDLVALGDDMGNADYAIEYWIESLRAENSTLQTNAVQMLARHGYVSLVPVMIEAMRDEPHVVYNLYRTVLAWSTDEHVRAIERAIRETRDANARRVFVDILRERATPACLDALVRCLDRPLNGVDRHGILETLGKHPQPDDFEGLLALFRAGAFEDGDQNAVLKSRALMTLGQFRDERALPVILENLDNARWTTAWFRLAGLKGQGSSSTMNTYAGLAALFEMGADTYLKTAVPLLSDSMRNANLRAEVIRFLAYIPGDESSRLIREALSHEEPRVRTLAARAAGHLLMLDMVPRLRELLRDPVVASSANVALLRFAEMGLRIE